jgi:hypothetical protein
MTDNVRRPRQKVRAAAWVAFGVSALISALEFWTISPASSDFFYTVFGPANENVVFYFLALLLFLAIFEIVTFFVVKGWRNRVIVIAGVVLLLVPFAGSVLDNLAFQLS